MRPLFERAIFYSWACQLEVCCKYCYMSTVPKDKRTKDKVRSFGSLLAETIITKECGWEYGFLSGGIGVFSDEKLLDLIKKTNEIIGQPIWINVGVLSKRQIEYFKPYIKGVVGTVEIMDPELHKKICPSKPIAPVEKMFDAAKEAGVERGMTLIVGLGETIADFDLLEKFIKKHGITKIHLYGLNPQKGTAFENASPPTVEYQSLWISKIRDSFPEIDIQAGIWLDRTDYVGDLLKAGANTLSKFPALKSFGGKEAVEIEAQARQVGRKFSGSMTVLPSVDWDSIVDGYSFDEKLKSEIKKKLHDYLKKMK